MTGQAVRLPPPLNYGADVREPFMECGQRVRLSGKLVECIRRSGHPVTLNFAHSNGIQEWCFDEGDALEVASE